MSSASIFRVPGVYRNSAHRDRDRCSKFSVTLSMKDVSACYQSLKMEDASEGHDMRDFSESSDFRFDRMLPSYEEIDSEHKREFGRYIAREAMWSEEYWTAAWLRAEAIWEDQSSDRYVYSFMKQFAGREFLRLKQQCGSKFGEKCTCIVAVKKNQQIRRKNTALNSVVGTLDVNIRYLLLDATFPSLQYEERDKDDESSSSDNAGAQRYGYVSNLCVKQSARRQGIASNMLLLAVRVAKLQGVADVFVHVNKDNIAAQLLYEKIGFQMVEASDDRTYLMRFKA